MKICGRLTIIYLSNIAQIAKPMCLRNLAIVPIAAGNYNSSLSIKYVFYFIRVLNYKPQHFSVCFCKLPVHIMAFEKSNANHLNGANHIKLLVYTAHNVKTFPILLYYKTLLDN
jgi:hypothetical protein